MSEKLTINLATVFSFLFELLPRIIKWKFFPIDPTRHTNMQANINHESSFKILHTLSRIYRSSVGNRMFVLHLPVTISMIRTPKL